LHEVVLYIASKKKEEEYTKFRYEVKKRLYKKYQDWLQVLLQGGLIVSLSY